VADVGEPQPQEQSDFDVLVAGGALIAAAALFVSLWGYLVAPSECRKFGQSDFFACGVPAAMTAVGDAVAAVATAALIAGTPIRPPRWMPFLGRAALAAAGVAALASVARLVGQADALSRVVAGGWLVIGLWLFYASRTAPVVMRSTLGVVLGVTLVVSGLLESFGEERPFPVGGALFSIAFGAWAIRLASRLFRSWRARPPRPDTAFGVMRDVLVGLGIAFVALPAWLSSTIGFAPIGDPGVTITVANQTSHAIDFYLDRGWRLYADAPRYATRIGPGASGDVSGLAHGAYSPAAADPGGSLVFCGHFSDSELRLKMRYRITVVDDPASCR